VQAHLGLGERALGGGEPGLGELEGALGVGIVEAGEDLSLLDGRAIATSVRRPVIFAETVACRRATT
jgi:hypothetical protein